MTTYRIAAPVDDSEPVRLSSLDRLDDIQFEERIESWAAQYSVAWSLTSPMPCPCC